MTTLRQWISKEYKGIALEAILENYPECATHLDSPEYGVAAVVKALIAKAVEKLSANQNLNQNLKVGDKVWVNSVDESQPVKYPGEIVQPPRGYEDCGTIWVAYFLNDGTRKVCEFRTDVSDENQAIEPRKQE